MVVNTTGFTGFAPPSVFARYQMAARLVQCRAELRCAWRSWHAPSSSIRRRSAMLMMQNRGATSEAFTNELDALKWLDSRQPDSARRVSSTAPMPKTDTST